VKLETVADERGVHELSFSLEVGDTHIPGLLWVPSGEPEGRPVVSLGHGGTRHKRYGYILQMARRLVRHLGFAAAAIDAPNHGDRRNPSLPAGAVDASMEQVAIEWQATLNALRDLPAVGQGPVGYWGLSMGCSLGVPFVASEPRVGAAVIGLSGRHEAVRKVAEDITCPVLFLAQWDDELVPRDDALALFDSIGSTDKVLHANPGRHQDVPVREFEAAEFFFRDHLAEPAAMSLHS
jgi:dienelactone hydrolase